MLGRHVFSSSARKQCEAEKKYIYIHTIMNVTLCSHGAVMMCLHADTDATSI